MFQFVALLAVISYAQVAAVPQLDGRIVQGAPSAASSFPWQVSLQRNGSHFCGGTIYSSQIIVTAAHCLVNVFIPDLRVRAGSSFWINGGVLVGVAALKIHKGYKPKKMVNDVAVIRLNSSLTFSSTIRPINLAFNAPESGAVAVVSGWGTTKSGSHSLPTQLKYVEMKILNYTDCASSSYGYGFRIKKGMICTYSTGKDSCQGDSGGPLVSGGVLVGVVSWGFGCAFSNYPGVYTDVHALRPWIIKTANSIQ